MDDKDAYLRMLNDMITDKVFDSRVDFLRSLRSQLKEKGSLTEKQQKAIFTIYQRGA